MSALLKSPYLLRASLVILAGVSLTFTARAQDSREDDFKAVPPPGKRIYDTTCAGCHGLDGRGSERAPSIAAGAKVERLSDTQLAGIVSNGIPGTGMPAFHSLTAAQVHSLVSYLRVLQGKNDASSIPGDAARGRQIFFGKGECSTCHTVNGEGGFLGPDLSGHGTSTPAAAVRQQILNADRIVPPGYRAASAITSGGLRVDGVIRNEDNFSVQLLDKDGNFHFFQKSDLQKLEYNAQPLMPTDYAKRLSSSEVDDLVNYLIHPASPGPTNPPSKAEDHRE